MLGNLPPELTSFVGRRAEVTAAKRRLAESRLVTLIGVGGVGKTRLALRVAASLRREFPDGVWLVELDRLQDESLLAQSVAMALGLRESRGGSSTGLLADHLADRRLLLVLDNCEHLIEAVAKLTEVLLRAGPQLRILATSRERLGIDGETPQAVPPLLTPDPGRPGRPGEAAFYEAVALFVDRARAVLPGFELTEGNLAAVVQICHRLDGLSLAIELAAARLRVLSPEQVNARLGDRLALLTGGSRVEATRQQTLRACVGWSFDLCTPSEQRLWARLSAFVGGFEQDAVEGVCTGADLAGADLPELLAALVTKSVLVGEEHGGVSRYRMLENIRLYGTERLRAAGAEPGLRRRHRDFYERLVMQAEADWIGPRQVELLDRLEREQPNIRAALEFSLTEPGETPSALRMCGALHSYWVVRGLTTEGRRWLDRALTGSAEASVERVEAMYTATVFASLQGDVATAAALARDGDEVAAQLTDARSQAIATLAKGAPPTHSGDPASAVPYLEAALGVFRAEDDVYWTVMALAGLAMVKAFIGDPDGAAATYESLLSITQARGEVRLQGFSLWALGVGLWKRGEPVKAAARLKQSLRLRSRMKDTFGTALCLDALAWIAADRGQARRAAILLGVVATLSRNMGSPVATYPDLLAFHEQCERKAREALGEQALRAALEQGAELTLDDAIGYALKDRTAEPAPATGAGSPGTAGIGNVLTRREWQICELVADGLTNKEVAARLCISQRTAESHVQNVLNKLGFTGREHISAWVVAHRRDADR